MNAFCFEVTTLKVLLIFCAVRRSLISFDTYFGLYAQWTSVCEICWELQPNLLRGNTLDLYRWHYIFMRVSKKSSTRTNAHAHFGSDLSITPIISALNRLDHKMIVNCSKHNTRKKSRQETLICKALHRYMYILAVALYENVTLLSQRWISKTIINRQQSVLNMQRFNTPCPEIVKLYIHGRLWSHPFRSLAYNLVQS